MISRRANKWKQNTGGTTVEAAISLVVFMPFLLVGISLAIASYQIASAQFFLSKAARYGISSETLSQMNAIDLIETRIIDLGRAAGLNFDVDEIHICPVSDPNCIDDNLGSNTDLILMRLNYQLKVMNRSLPLDLNASVLMRREPV